jgi:peptidoglycan-associated lipoprotein
MKMMKMICPLALAIALAATGCKHQPVGITKLSPGPTPPPQEESATTLAGTQMNPDTSLTSTAGGGGIPAASPASFDGMIEDTNALAADTILFSYDSAAIRKSEHANLQAVAAALSGDATLKLLIQGNCDERGTEEYNRSLGERRALAAREGLAKLGVDPARVRTISFGKDQPVDPGHDESAWAKNRRDDFVLLHPNPNAPAGGMGGS